MVADCTFNSIVACFNNDTSLVFLKEEWRTLSRALETPKLKEKLLEEDLKFRTKSVLDVLEELLVVWRMRHSQNAKLTVFINVLQQKCQWIDIAGMCLLLEPATI